MPALRVILIALAVLIAINIPSVAMPVFMSGADGKVTSLFFWMILAGFILAPIAVPFIFRKYSSGLIILFLATAFVFSGSLMIPNAMQGTSAIWKAFNLSLGHLLMLVIAVPYCILHKNTKNLTSAST